MALATVGPVVAATLAGQDLTLHRLQEPPPQVLRHLACLDDRAPQNRFPGPNPVSLDTSHFGTLKSEPYVACEKTDGIRMLLVCCTVPTASGGSVNLVALVDRAHAWYVCPLRHVPKALFQGSLLDGELAWNKTRGGWDYLVFDAVTVSGIPVLNCTLHERMRGVGRGLAAYKAAPSDPVIVRLKRFVPCTDNAGVRDLAASTAQTYDIDGLILTPELAPVTYGRHMRMFKLKFGHRHTVDFLVARNCQDLLVYDHGKHVVVARLAGNAYAHPDTIVECTSAGDDGWTVVGVRTDKTTANDMFTYRKTLLNMKERLDWDRICGLFAQ